LWDLGPASLGVKGLLDRRRVVALTCGPPLKYLSTDPPLADQVEHRRVLQQGRAVPDALRVQEKDRLADLGRRSPLAGMHGAAQPEVPGEGEGTGVVTGMMPVGGVWPAGEVDADDGRAVARDADGGA
jgi:hypothetical protein